VTVVHPGPSPAEAPTSERVERWPRLSGLAFGGDYNAEQWPREIWAEDLRLMQEAGVNLVTVGVFSWALMEPEEGRYDLDWLSALMDGLDAAGIAVDLATPTASPPAWFSRTYPSSLPVQRDGTVLGPGAREHFCPSSREYRLAATRLAGELARRFADHPALVMWHVGNEFGSHVGQCWCARSRDAFVEWLRNRYGDLGTLNRVWGTAFWGQQYARWEHVGLPGPAPMPGNPSQNLDFLRFCSQEYLECYRAERDALRAVTPKVPVTTNFMLTACKNVDYWKWVDEVDLVANDHYLTAEDPESHIDLALSADVTRGLAKGRPWLLMEHSTGAVNWQPRNLAKAPGEMRRNSFGHIARGADGTLFFQWRASAFGAEKFHSAMLPQAGTDSRAWRDVVDLGDDLARAAAVRGSEIRAEVAMVWDWESWWALELDFRPSSDVTYRDRVHAFYRELWLAGRTVDVVSPDADLSAYRVVVVPSLYLVSAAVADNLGSYVRAGGHLVVSFFSGVVDETEAVPDGPYPGMLRDVLGLTVEEFHPLAQGTQVTVVEGDGTIGAEASGTDFVADTWSETVRLRGARAISWFSTGPDAGLPAVTRHDEGAGTAWYVATRPSPAGLDALLTRVCREAACSEPVRSLGVEAVRRHGQDTSYLFLLNHGADDASVLASGTDLLTGLPAAGAVVVPAGGVVVLAEDPPVTPPGRLGDQSVPS